MKYVRSVLFHFNFGLILGLSHITLVLTWNLFGYRAFMKIVALYNLLLHLNLKTLGTKIKFILNHELPTDRPLIIVANHQSTFDIPALIWHFRKHHVKFVAKQELKSGFPCVSYTLNRNGSVFADRLEPKKAIEEIQKLGRHISEKNFSAVIFPEGRRSKKLIRFRANGLGALLSSAPNALIQPVVIHNLWKLELSWPMNTGVSCSWTCLPPIDNDSERTEELIPELHELIRQEIEKRKVAESA